MRRLLGNRGFTIIEAMIVLAVTGGLFIAIAATMAGRQAKGEYNQSIGDARTQVQQTLNEVESGTFPDFSNFTCSVAGSGLSFLPASQAQGTNDQCLFLGKMLVFTQGSDIFKVYTVAGKRVQTITGSQYNLYDDNPTIVDTTQGGGSVNLTETHQLLYGLNPVKVQSGFGTNLGAVAFITSLGKVGKDSAGNPSGYASGAQQVELDTFNASFTSAPSIASLNTALRSSSQQSSNDPGGVKICFKSGTTNDYALMTIGADNSNLSVDMQPNPNVDCGL